MNAPALDATILTLFPEMFPGPLGYSLAGKALAQGKWSLNTINIRDFATDKHGTVDDTPYGGGAGMVLKPDIVDAAITSALAKKPGAQLVYMTPRGRPLTQKMVVDLHQKPLVILCGRFEAIDERVIEHHHPLEISLGDYVLSGGEVAAIALLDACIRLLPGVMSDSESLAEESFGLSQEYALLLEYPHYTKPPLWKGRPVPEVLISGNHAKIKAWRLEQAEKITQARRTDLWNAYALQKTGNKKK